MWSYAQSCKGDHIVGQHDFYKQSIRVIELFLLFFIYVCLFVCVSLLFFFMEILSLDKKKKKKMLFPFFPFMNIGLRKKKNGNATGDEMENILENNFSSVVLRSFWWYSELFV